MRAVAFCLLALVVAASAREFPVAQYRSLLQLTELNCQADSMATLDLRGSGSGRASAQSFCKALADAEVVVRSVVEKYFEAFTEDSSNGQCTEAQASEVVTGVAKAVAEAYVSVTTEVQISGTGEACAQGFAAGDALAISLVKVYLEVSVELIEKKYPTKSYHEDVQKVIDDKENRAAGAVRGSAFAAVIAKAWVAATSSICTKGGFEKDEQDAFVRSTTTAIAELWATVIVELCSNFDDASKDELKEWAERTSESFSNIEGDVTIDTEVVESSTAGGATQGVSAEIPPCTDNRGICCSASNKAGNACACGSGCSMKKGSGGEPGQTIWVSDAEDADRCFCD